MRTALGLVVILLVASIASAGPEAPAASEVLGKTIEPFRLQDFRGAWHALDDWSDRKGLVVVFLGVECPLCRLYGPRLAELAAEYEGRGVTFIGVDSNQQDSLGEIAHYAQEHRIDFPLLKDPGASVADQFSALRTPQAFVLDGRRRVVYHGRVDDQYGVGYARATAAKRNLAAALDEMLAGKEISVPTTEPAGCFIGRPSRQTPRGEITYSKHVAGILQRRCVSCHRPGEIGPFAMNSYQEVVGWSETIREVVQQGRMPPWHASPKFGRFTNDRRLPDDEKQVLLKWIDDGAPEGNPRDLPPPIEYVEGWQIPKPDVVLTMPQTFKVPAKGVVEYQYFELEQTFDEDKWVQAAEARPGNRAVVHHLNLFFVPPGGRERKEEAVLYHTLAASAPGMPAWRFAEGTAKRVPAGSKLIFQVHYTPNGVEQEDQSCAGLVFVDPKSVRSELSTGAVLNFRFALPPGASDVKIEGSHRFESPVRLMALAPHMHLRGKSFRFEALFPDGGRETLLDVPRYDFNWQNWYFLAEPKPMPPGTELLCTAHFDNSAENLVNPDPAALVTWGEQTYDEMMVGMFEVAPGE
jgi:peroxiredoxin